MRIKVERINNILKFPDDVATLENIGPSGNTFIYKIRYEANIINAIKKQAINVKIRILKDEQQQKNHKIFTTGEDSDKVVTNLLLQKAKQKDLVRSKVNLILFETSSDISKKIPNDKIKTLTDTTLKNVKNNTKKVSVTKNENVIRPILAKNKAAFGDGLGIIQKVFKEEMKKVLLVHRTDPGAFLGSKSRTIIPTSVSFHGLINKKETKLTRINNNRKLQLVKENLLSITNPVSSIDLSDDEYISVTEVESQTFVVVEEILQIPIEFLSQPVFILELELFDKKGLSQQIISIRVNHKEKLNEILIPALPPTITSSPVHKPGKVTLLLKQNDENCDKINLYKKVVVLDQANIDSNFIFVKSVILEAGDGIQPVIDDHAAINPTIYRAIAVGKNGILGAEFGSVIISQDKTKVKFKNSTISNKDTVLTLTHKIINNFIELFVENIPSGPIALEIFRKDLTLNEKTATRLGNIIFLGNDKNETISYQDTNVKKDRIYEYYCNLIYKNGDTAIAKNNLIIPFETIESNITNLSTIIPTITEQDLDVEFFIEKNNVLNNIDITKKVLTDQNILTEYQDEITNEKERLQNLFFTRVLRTNKLNGEIEDFGIIDSTTFSDKKYGPVKNVKPLEAGLEYVYTIMVYAIAAEVLFEKYTREITVRTGVTYDLLPSKWLHPLTLNEGTITNKTISKSRHANTIFTFGKIADIQYINVNLNSILPAITNTKASVLSDTKTLIKWKISGEAKKIDHFIIILETMGSRTIVGKSHNITSTNDFQFIDILDNGEHGALKYIITPIYFDYSQGAEVFTNTIFI